LRRKGDDNLEALCSIDYLSDAKLRVPQRAWSVNHVRLVEHDLATLFRQFHQLPRQLPTPKSCIGQNMPLNLWIVTCHSLKRTQANPLYLPRKLIL